MGLADHADQNRPSGESSSDGSSAPSETPDSTSHVPDAQPFHSVPPASGQSGPEAKPASTSTESTPVDHEEDISHSVFSDVLDAAHHAAQRLKSEQKSAASESRRVDWTPSVNAPAQVDSPVASKPSEPTPLSPRDEELRSAIKISSADTFPVLDQDHTEFQAIIRQAVVEQVKAHADENPGVEVCGILVGTVYENPQASFVHIDAMIRGEGSGSKSTQVTFTAQTWQHVHQVMEQKYAGKRIIGWYHTHPGFGIFLSEMDLFIQRNFFNAAWQMAFVLDPKDQDAGMFAWRSAQVRRVDFVVDDEAVPVSPARVAAALPSGATTSKSPVFHEEPTAPINAATLEELADRIRVLELRIKWILAGFAALLLVAIVWPLIMTVVLPASNSSPGPARQPVYPDKRPEEPTSPKPDSSYPAIPPPPK